MSQDFESNLQDADKLLARFRNDTLPHFVNGMHDAGLSQNTFETIAPADNSIIGRVASGSVEDVGRACEVAEAAFEEWKNVPGKERKRLLHKVADAIIARARDIALVESIDSGQAIRFMTKAAVRGAANFQYFADMAPNARDGLSLPADEHLNYTIRQPIGPVGVITPWNTPFMLSTWKIAPALAAGCTVVHKPAAWSPYTGMMLAEIAHEAGLPDGVLNCVHGSVAVTGKTLTEHPAIKAVAFVGETTTGSQIMHQGAETLKRFHFELGGKNPVIVFEDADMDRALDAVVFMIFSLNGERCTSSSRLIIQESIQDEFNAKLIERIGKLKVGHPLDPVTEIGPLVHQNHFDKVCSYFDIAAKEGATIAAGGKAAQIDGKGNYVEPTLFMNASSSMTIAQQEIFGPVLTAIPFKDEADAIAIANDTDYGLAGYVWTNDIGRGHRMAHTLDAGMIWVNSENNRHLPSPFGGMKSSGIGRDGGDYSFDFYMETKNVCIAMGSHRVPQLGKA